MRCIIPNKVRFVNDLNKVIPTYKTGIEKIEYRVFKSNSGYYQEYLVVTYEGGAIGVRNCNGNSFTSIFEELTKMLDGGYYDEVQDLRDFETYPNWTEMILEQLDEDYQNR